MKDNLGVEILPWERRGLVNEKELKFLRKIAEEALVRNVSIHHRWLAEGVLDLLQERGELLREAASGREGAAR